MKLIDKEGYEYFEIRINKAVIVFFTAKKDLNFYIASESGKQNLELLKQWFNLEEVGCLNQIHSDIVHDHSGEVLQGDALITHRENIGIGVFTADCVPIILYDKSKNVIAAVHSGWKGTFDRICEKTIKKMMSDYGSEAGDIVVYIGPHIGSCCYEVSKELIDSFHSSFDLQAAEIAEEAESQHLNLQRYIIKQCINFGINNNNIFTMDICTFCCEQHEMYSYRKDNKKAGRMFSMVYLQD
jgi:polyphenol oxidase